MYRRGSIVWPLVLITLGILFLLANFNIIPDVGTFIGRFWPVILILFGLEILLGSMWRRGNNANVENLSVDLGSATTADVKIDFGAGQLSIGSAASGKLVDGTYAGGVNHHESMDGRVHLRAPENGWWWGWSWRGFNWRVGLTREVPLSLRVDVGAAQSDFDLSDLKVTDLVLKTGASSTNIRLPKAAGMTNVRVESGAASVKLMVPDGVAARIRSTMGLGSSNIDQHRFPRSGEYYQSPDYDSAANKIDIRSEGGVGSVSVS
jgi:cell wall-active antibiotic response 4TMS protein YvqF